MLNCCGRSVGAEGQSRTDTGSPPPVFETGASTIPPLRHRYEYEALSPVSAHFAIPLLQVTPNRSMASCLTISGPSELVTRCYPNGAMPNSLRRNLDMFPSRQKQPRMSVPRVMGPEVLGLVIQSNEPAGRRQGCYVRGGVRQIFAGSS